MNQEVDSLKEVCHQNEHTKINRAYNAVRNYLTEGHSGNYGLSKVERMRASGKRGRNSS